MKQFTGRANMKLYNQDCMSALEDMGEDEFDLAIVDPPYGNKDAINIKNSENHKANRKIYKQFDNKAPNKEYFRLIKEKSNKYIVWGGNYFGLSGGVIAWNKNGSLFGEGEVAICNTHKSVRFFEYTWNGMLQENMKDKEIRIHPTQKPIALYKWLLKNYAEEGDTILDTHLGSMSIAIACWDMGYDLVGYEIDEDYFKKGVKRVRKHTNQMQLF